MLIDEIGINFILSNIFVIKDPGLCYGRLGVCIALASYVKISGNDEVEPIVYESLAYTLATPVYSISYEYGKAGIGIGLMYMIENRILNVDYQEIFNDDHEYILNEIVKILSSNNSSDNDLIDLVDGLLYLSYYCRIFDVLDSREICLIRQIIDYLNFSKLFVYNNISFNKLFERIVIICNYLKEIDLLNKYFDVLSKYLYEYISNNELITDYSLNFLNNSFFFFLEKRKKKIL